LILRQMPSPQIRPLRRSCVDEPDGPRCGARVVAVNPAAIEFNNVEKRYGAQVVLDRLCFAVPAGEHLALIGPSGSGKTTILRVLMTIESIDAGTVSIDGELLLHESRGGRLAPASARHLQRVRNKIGMVFQQFNLFPHMSVLENVALAPVLNGRVDRRKARADGLVWLNVVDLADKAEERPARLSGGQKQRVAIARALALQPKIMLFDEITSALDPELIEEVLHVVQRVGRETDMTMLLVTHEMSFAREFADRVLFFDGGRIVEEGPPAQLFSQPSSERTRKFLKKIIAAGLRV